MTGSAEKVPTLGSLVRRTSVASAALAEARCAAAWCPAVARSSAVVAAVAKPTAVRAQTLDGAAVRSAAVCAAAMTVLACARQASPGAAGSTPAAPRLLVTAQASGTRALLQAVSAVDENVVWVSGHRATWARTTDGGATWHAGAMAGPDSTLQFRDVHAVNALTAYLLAAGPGAASRIYKTTDGGASWTLQFQNRDSSAFYDCFDFWDADHGVAVSDAVGDRMIIITTSNGGATWTRLPDGAVPPALENEGAFAASGTCLTARAGGRAWIGTGAVSGARVYHTRDHGRTWSVVTTPVVSGPASGIASVIFRDDRHGMALGGRIGAPEEFSDNVAVTDDGGRTWRLAARTPVPGAMYGAAYLPGSRAVVAASPKGLVISPDEGASWSVLAPEAYWAVGFGGPGAGWAVGPGGRIMKLSLAPDR